MGKFMIYFQKVGFVFIGVALLFTSIINFLRPDIDIFLWWICLMFFIGGLISIYAGLKLKE